QVGTGWTVQAHFAGDFAYEPSDSELVSYNTVESNLTEFLVLAGVNSAVELSSFESTIIFDNVTADGSLFVQRCAAPESDRYIAVDGMCLEISPGFQLEAGSAAHIQMSLDGRVLPEGESVSDIDIFLEQPVSGEIIDITEGKDLSGLLVTGRAEEFNKFIGGIALHNVSQDVGARQQVLVGQEAKATLRDISNLSNATAVVELDRDHYRITDIATITIIDSDANLDNLSPDQVSASVFSSSGTMVDGISVPLTETNSNSGVFMGHFGFKSGSSNGNKLGLRSGDEISVSYNHTFGGRFEAVFENIDEAGLAEMTDYQVEEFPCFKPIGGAVNLRLLGASLDEGSSFSVTMSYANALLLGDVPSNLRMFHK
ncbi:MAG TPA: hypothetical protein VJ742_11745, partial [Nitrososphaera sp.]|nr:hypothetical protein [Nitrososphaera sp.]